MDIKMFLEVSSPLTLASLVVDIEIADGRGRYNELKAAAITGIANILGDVEAEELIDEVREYHASHC